MLQVYYRITSYHNMQHNPLLDNRIRSRYTPMQQIHASYHKLRQYSLIIDAIYQFRIIDVIYLLQIHDVRYLLRIIDVIHQFQINYAIYLFE